MDGAEERASVDQTFWRRFVESESREDYCRAWLTLQIRRLRGVRLGLVVLGRPDVGPFTPAATWPEGRAEVTRLGEAAERALRNRRGLILRRTSTASDDGEEKHDAHLAWPLVVRDKLRGAVVIEVEPRAEAELSTALRELQWGAAWLEVLLRREEAGTGATRERLETVLDMVAAGVEQEGFSANATTFLTQLASRLACERVSLGVVRRARVRVRMMSHSSQKTGKTNLVRALEYAMEEAYDQEQTVVHPRRAAGRFQVGLAHEAYARESGASSVCSTLLGRDGKVYGVLTLERTRPEPFDAETVELVEAIAAIAGPILELERRDERWIGHKVWDATRAQVVKLVGEGHAIFKLCAVAALVVVAFFTVAGTDYRITSDTVIEAEFQRVAVVPFASYVAEEFFRAGDVVSEGDVLARLDDKELQLERLRLASQRDQQRKQYDQHLAERKAAQVNIVAAQIAQTSAQLELIEDQLSKTRIASPIAGIVVTGDLSQAIGAPVERGQVLFEVAPLDAFRLVLEVDERDVAEVAVGQKGEVALSAFPTEPLDFTVTKITPVSVSREGRNYFRVEAALSGTHGRMRPGMEGVGKIDVGRRKLIWVWTHRGIDWLRMFVWTWSP